MSGPSTIKWGGTLGLAPVVVSAAWSVAGLLFLKWSVADLFFWFWCELLLTGLATFAMVTVWQRTLNIQPPEIGASGIILYGFSFTLVLFFGSIFSALAYIGEWQTWSRFPEFFQGKILPLAMAVVALGAATLKLWTRQDRGLTDRNRPSLQFTRKSWVVLGFYAVLMMHHHWSGANKLSLSTHYLSSMGLLLIMLKLVAEIGILDRLLLLRSTKRSA